MFNIFRDRHTTFYSGLTSLHFRQWCARLPIFSRSQVGIILILVLQRRKRSAKFEWAHTTNMCRSELNPVVQLRTFVIQVRWGPERLRDMIKGTMPNRVSKSGFRPRQLSTLRFSGWFFFFFFLVLLKMVFKKISHFVERY